MMRKIVALLLAAVLFAAGISAAFAEAAPASMPENWYMTEALNLADAMGALADNEAYVELFIGMGMDTDGFADTMAKVAGLAPDQVITYLYRTDALEKLAASYQMDEVSTKLAGPAMDAINIRMSNSLGSLLNGHVGGELWLAVASSLAYTRTYIMPAGFVPCSLFLSYEGQETAVLVTFSQTGEETVTATATYVRAGVWADEVAQTYLDLMWEPME